VPASSPPSPEEARPPWQARQASPPARRPPGLPAPRPAVFRSAQYAHVILPRPPPRREETCLNVHRYEQDDAIILKPARQRRSQRNSRRNL